MLCVCWKKNHLINQFSLLLLLFSLLRFPSFPFISSSHSICSVFHTPHYWPWKTQLGMRISWSQHLCVLTFSSTLHGTVPCAPCPGMQLTASLWKEIPSPNRLGGIWHPIIQTEYNVISPMGSAEGNEFPPSVMYEAASAISVCWASCFIPSFPANL